MSIKRIIVLGKLWLLLLLLSQPVAAKSLMGAEDVQDSKSRTLYQATASIHKEGLQPQVPSVRIICEHHAKPLSFGYILFHYDENSHFVLGYVGQTTLLLQDANRCESVSRFLFPYHFFW